ncbi:MAG: hypothetical protein WC602_03370 [archaeon]
MAEARKQKGFWTKGRAIIAIILVAGLFFGAAFEHYLVEPLLERQAAKQLSECTSERGLLEGQATELAGKLDACNSK